MKEEISNWNECIFYQAAIKTNTNKLRARSLIGTAIGRLPYAEKREAIGEEINYKFEDYYTSVVELLQALLVLDGYNVLNHICLGYYLRDILKKEQLFKMFDDCRIKRNSLIYYGKKMEVEPAEITIEKAKLLITELNLLLKQKLQ
jgi:hypothetical protein